MEGRRWEEGRARARINNNAVRKTGMTPSTEFCTRDVTFVVIVSAVE